MVNEVEMAQELLCPFCVLCVPAFLSLAGNSQSASGFECWKRMRTGREDVGEALRFWAPTALLLKRQGAELSCAVRSFAWRTKVDVAWEW
jgi:hypothetical protein